jgi:hypothetical protein
MMGNEIIDSIDSKRYIYFSYISDASEKHSFISKQLAKDVSAIQNLMTEYRDKITRFVAWRQPCVPKQLSKASRCIYLYESAG